MTLSLVRRRLFQTIAGGLSLPLGSAGRAATPDDWSLYCQRFVASDGRVTDNGNGMQSHSEGQGYGLLFAQAFDDRATFDRMFVWTEQTLKRPDDALHAWHYLPDASPHVPDQNNATDGDLLIALALVLAGRRWGRSDLIESARAIYAALRAQVVVTVGHRMLLLPGLYGFSSSNHVVINPSYYIMPSLMAASDLDDHDIWQRVIHDGLDLLRQGRFGRWNLPPDWMQVTSEVVTIARGHPARFSYDAVRVPLYLQWAGLLDADLRSGFMRYWNAWGEGGMPAWVDLRSGMTAPYNAPLGFYAVGIASGLLDMPGAGNVPFPALAASSNYYSASLTLLSSLILGGLAYGVVQQKGAF